MREWYGLVGRRNDIWSRQDATIQPDDLLVANGVLEFLVENQGVTSWAVRQNDLQLEDPPVVVRDQAGRWVEQSPRFSEFALHLFAYVIQFSDAAAQIHGNASSRCVQRLEADLPKLGFPEFIWPGCILFGFSDLVVCVDQTDHVSASALSSEAMEPFQRLIRGEVFEIIAQTGAGVTNGN
jgi:hypothetical protein